MIQMKRFVIAVTVFFCSLSLFATKKNSLQDPSERRFRRGDYLAIAGEIEGGRELWVGKTLSTVLANQHNFEVQWLSPNGPTKTNWVLIDGNRDLVFRNTVVGVVESVSQISNVEIEISATEVAALEAIVNDNSIFNTPSDTTNLYDVPETCQITFEPRKVLENIAQMDRFAREVSTNI
jgi:hypothetical protein